MTRTSTTTIAVAADYADAMMTARRAKNWLFIILLLILLAQITVFFLVKFQVLRLGDRVDVAATPASVDVDAEPAGDTQPTTDATAVEGGATTAPADGDGDAAATASTPAASRSFSAADVLRYVIPVMNFLGITLTIVLAVVLLLITLIMLVGRLIGVSHVTGSFIWSVLLIVFLFPWQTLLISHPGDASPGLSDAAQRDNYPAFKIPGVLYTWPELRDDHDFSTGDPGGALGAGLKWARFAGLPVVALLILLMVQAKSSRGLKFALGESDVQVEVSTPPM